MGIRFSCQNGHKLHVKNFLAGKRGVCPECGVTVDIPAVGIHRQPQGLGTTARSVEQGRVTENCLLWKEGWADWRAAFTISPTLASVPGPKPSRPNSPQLDSESPILEQSQVTSPPSADSTANEIRIETHVPQKTSKHKKRWLAYLLIAACLLLSLPLVYVFSNN